ncbi:MAG: hypothetical protein AWU57_1677 [Marinobacter sp. T13-3]|nr:MAG: hypothetical protein AWU57_1677 [Marinobacter sp. T13-3]
MPPLTSTNLPPRLTALSVAIAGLLGTGYSGESAALCGKQMADNEIYNASANCTGEAYAVQVGNAAADTLEVSSNVTLGGDGSANSSVGGVVIGLGSAAGSTQHSSLSNLTNNGSIPGYDDSVASPMVAGNGILMYSNASSIPTNIREIR